ncbi:MAG TPA: hypothetical protein VM012_09090 [Flavitalea sp.]|nr:hypothetical protein [Flavitalea sp.]
MRFCFLVLFTMATATLTAQNLTGIWRGTRTQSPGGCFPEYSLELQITYSGNNILGRAFNFYDKERYTKIIFSGRYNPQTKRMVIIESAVLTYNIPNSCIPCIKTYDLTWTKSTTEEALNGEWKGHEMGNSNVCPPGKIHLTKQTQSVFPVEVIQNDTLSSLQRNMKIMAREKEVVQNIIIDTNQIKIELYDNAEIDDDTVSVFLNNTLLLHKKRLTDKALVLHFTAFPNTDYEIMMYAENLGRIPPNTSLMIITAGKKRYEMRISSNEQKNAVVRFRFQQ